jgi:hypothetical protein
LLDIKLSAEAWNAVSAFSSDAIDPPSSAQRLTKADEPSEPPAAAGSDLRSNDPGN